MNRFRGHFERGSDPAVVLERILRAGEGKILRKLKSLAEQVNAVEEDFVGMTDEELRHMTVEFRERLADGETLDDILVEAFATAREAAKRTLGQRHFDVQIMGGSALHLGNIAEMKTGEGKTLTSVLPAYLNALSGKGVHVVTVNDYLAIDNLYEAVNTPLVGYLNNALKAKELYKRDRDYVVMGDEVLIVDEFTGRILHGRRYNEGMHQAIEAKEGVRIQDENQTLATITLQNYFRLYDTLSGMTGTAMTEAAEFSQIYKLGVVQIPTNRPMVRLDQADVVYKSESAKWDAVVGDIVERHEKGQPILVGTVSVEKSEHLSGMLLRRGIPHEVLNAKYHEKEAAIVAQAGRRGSVTVATNMAGRGTDIMLGGNPEFLAAADLAGRGLSPIDTPEDYEAAWPDALAKAKASVEAEHNEVVSLGGVYVLGTERHESRRIDNQLRGRSGRQGDPGESRFYLSLGDDLMRLFNAHMVESIMDRLNLPEDVPIESKMVSRSIRSAQTQIEQQNFEIRKNVLKYDEVLNKQRTVIYDERRRVLLGEDIHEQVLHMIEDTVQGYVQAATGEGYAEDWDLDTLWTGLKQLYPVSSTPDELEERSGGGLSSEYLQRELVADALAAYPRHEEELTVDVLHELERRVILSVLDRNWRE